MFDRETNFKPTEARTGLRLGLLQTDLSLMIYRDRPAHASVQASQPFIIYCSQFPLDSSMLSIEVGHTDKVGRTQTREFLL